MLFVSTAARSGGAERSLELLIRSLHDMGWNVAVACPPEALRLGAFERRSIRRFTLLAFEPVRRPGILSGLALLLRGSFGILVVLRAILLVGPRIVHANTTPAMLIAMIPAALTRRNLIWHVRDLVPLGRLGRVCSRAGSAIIAVSRTVREHLRRQGVSIPKTRVIHNGTDPLVTHGTSIATASKRLKAGLGLPPDAFVYLNVGQYAVWKRQDLFLEAAAHVRRDCERAHFVLVGRDPCTAHQGERDRLEILAAKLGLSRHLVFLPWCDDIAPILAGADVIVHSAEAEPFGRILIEAMQMGRPVIAVGAAGPTEIIEDGRTGLLAEPGQTVSLARLMLRLHRDPVLAARLARAGRERVAKRFTARGTAHSVARLYRQLLDGR